MIFPSQSLLSYFFECALWLRCLWCSTFSPFSDLSSFSALSRSFLLFLWSLLTLESSSLSLSSLKSSFLAAVARCLCFLWWWCTRSLSFSSALLDVSCLSWRCDFFSSWLLPFSTFLEKWVSSRSLLSTLLSDSLRGRWWWWWWRLRVMTSLVISLCLWCEWCVLESGSDSSLLSSPLFLRSPSLFFLFFLRLSGLGTCCFSSELFVCFSLDSLLFFFSGRCLCGISFDIIMSKSASPISSRSKDKSCFEFFSLWWLPLVLTENSTPSLPFTLRKWAKSSLLLSNTCSLLRCFNERNALL